MNKKRLAAIVAVTALASALSFGGAFAYLADTKSVNNVFTIGNVDVETTEPDYPGNESETVKNQEPNQETKKNPMVTNTGTTDAVVFLRVKVPVRTITPVLNDGSKGTTGRGELFYMKLASDPVKNHKNHFHEDWVELKSKETGTDLQGEERTYVFGYKNVLSAEESTPPLFDKVQLRSFLEGEVDPEETLSVTVETIAIQAGSFTGSKETISTDGDMDEAILEKIYDLSGGKKK